MKYHGFVWWLHDATFSLSAGMWTPDSANYLVGHPAELIDERMIVRLLCFIDQNRPPGSPPAADILLHFLAGHKDRDHVERLIHHIAFQVLVNGSYPDVYQQPWDR